MRRIVPAARAPRISATEEFVKNALLGLVSNARVNLANGNIALTLVALFSVMGIPSLPPVFLAVTGGMPHAQRRKIAIQSALAVGLTMVLLFGIDIDAFRVAGALVVASMAWGMITAKPSAILGSGGSSPAIIPLAIPKTAGPGAIATVIALGESQSDRTA